MKFLDIYEEKGYNCLRLSLVKCLSKVLGTTQTRSKNREAGILSAVFHFLDSEFMKLFVVAYGYRIWFA